MPTRTVPVPSLDGDALFQRSLECAPFGAVVAATTQSGRCLYVNPEFTAITGYTIEDIPTVSDWLRLAYPDPAYRSQIEANWSADVARENMNRDVIYKVTCKDGSQKLIQLRANLLDPGLMFVMLLDVSDREHAASELMVYRHAISSCHDAIAFADLDLRLSYVNPAWLTLWGYNHEDEVLGRLATDFWVDSAPAEAAAQAVVANGFWHGELTGVRHDGQLLPLWISATLARDHNGAPKYLMAWLSNLTDRSQTLAEPLESRARLNAAVESLPFHFYAFDQSGCYAMQNSAVHEAFGDIIGKRPEDVAPDPETLALWLANRRRALSGETTESEWSCRVNGRQRTYRSILKPIMVNAVITGALGCNIDITETKEAEAERLELLNRLHRSERLEAIGQLAGGVAHDFNNLLTTIHGNAELLQMDLEPGHPATASVNQIKGAARRAADLTKQLLSFARHGQHKPAKLDVHKLIHEVHGLLVRVVDPQVRIELDLQATHAVTQADAAQLQTALLNLGLNARDAIPAAGSIRFATRIKVLDEIPEHLGAFDLAPGNYVEISVTDTGTGIAPEILPQIFEAFFTTKPVDQGTGLGLASVYSVAKSHRGAVSVSSKLGEGARFELLLPLAAGVETVSQVSLPKRQAAPCGRALVIDDEASIRMLAQKMLTRLGWTVFSSPDGQRGVDCFREHPDISLVILDLVMPQLTGSDTFHALRELAPDLTIVVCTGNLNQNQANALIAAGAAGFLRKPFTFDDLSTQIANALS